MIIIIKDINTFFCIFAKKKEMAKDEKENKPNPVLNMIFENEPQIPDIDPYAHEEEIKAARSMASRRGRRKGADKAETGPEDNRRVNISFSAAQRSLIDGAHLCYSFAEGQKIGLSAFVVKMLEIGLEASSPEAWSLYKQRFL